MASPKKNKKETAWYVFAALIGLTGIVFLVFGIVGDHFPGLYSDNWIASSENAWLTNWSHMGYRWWGIILIIAAAVIASIALTVFAKEDDRDSERMLRRQQRLAMSAVVDEVPAEQPSSDEADA